MMFLPTLFSFLFLAIRRTTWTWRDAGLAALLLVAALWVFRVESPMENIISILLILCPALFGQYLRSCLRTVLAKSPYWKRTVLPFLALLAPMYAIVAILLLSWFVHSSPSSPWMPLGVIIAAAPGALLSYVLIHKPR